jgi:sterol desaturase/sphingolipid hydroxylase (fatty acid hydroxylase superfamily)
MTHWEIVNDKKPIRLFQSDFMEFFTHIHPAVVVVLWLPVAVGMLVWAILNRVGDGFPGYIPVGYLLGLFLWTFMEYTLHRFLFHYPAKTERQRQIFFLFHGVHHAQPQCKTRLVMPPVLSIPMAAVFYGLFVWILGSLLGHPEWVQPMFSAFITGYLIYDLTHYATHHFPMRSGYLKFLKRYHMQHHYKTPDDRYGVSTPLWDYVFGTYVK